MATDVTNSLNEWCRPRQHGKQSAEWKRIDQFNWNWTQPRKKFALALTIVEWQRTLAANTSVRHNPHIRMCAKRESQEENPVRWIGVSALVICCLFFSYDFNTSIVFDGRMLQKSLIWLMDSDIIDRPSTPIILLTTFLTCALCALGYGWIEGDQ